MQKTLRVLALAGVALMLAACQSAPVEDPEGTGCVPAASGAASEDVQVSGDVLSLPEVEFPEGLTAASTQRSVVVPGDGRIAEEGSLVTFGYVAYNGTTGETVDSVGYETPFTQATVDESALMAGLAKSLLCGETGSRLAAVIPPADAFGTTGNEQFGIGADDSIIFVIDVVAVASDRADGEDQPPIDGMPTVELSSTGEPTITVPQTTASAELQTAVLKKGDGAEVSEGATVTLEYTGVVWATGKTFDTSWTRPDLVQLPTTNFVAGFGSSLVGQTVGSQILMVIPPALGYGAEGNPDAGISGTDTLVFVVDILAAVQPAPAP